MLMLIAVAVTAAALDVVTVAMLAIVELPISIFIPVSQH